MHMSWLSISLETKSPVMAAMMIQQRSPKKSSGGGKNPTSEPGSGSAKPPTKPDGTSTKYKDSKNKRKRSDTSSSAKNGDDAQPPTKTPKRSAPDFSNITEAKLARWLQHCPDEFKQILLKEHKKPDGTREIDEFNVVILNQARWAPERIFTSTFHGMQTEANTENGLSDNTLKSLVAWKRRSGPGSIFGANISNTDKDGMKNFFKKNLMADKVKKKIAEIVKDKKTGQKKDVLVEEKEADLPDCRRDEGKWSEYWVKEAQTIVESTIIEPTVIEPTLGT
jgi:hypothetical protein